MKLGIHRPTVKGKDKSALAARNWVNGSAKPMTRGFMDGMWRSSLATLGYAHAEIAHFATQSREAFLKRALRGNVNAKPDKYDATYFGIFDRNETDQPGLAPYLPAVKTRVAQYLSDPELARAYASAMAWHESALTRLRLHPDHLEKLGAMGRASAIPFDDLDDVLFTQPLAPAGKTMVADMQAKGVPERDIARAVTRAVHRLEARRDASDAAELLARGITPDHGDWA